MRRLLLFISVSLTLLSNALFAQNCPANPTYKNQSNTFDLSQSGVSYVVNNGSSVNITIQNGFSANSSICVTNGSTLNLNFQNLNNPKAGGTIYVDQTSKLNLTGNNINNFPLTITNYGTVTQNVICTYTDGASINNFGTYTVSQTFTFNSGTVVLNNSGDLSFSGLVQFNTGTFSVNNLAGGVMTFSNSINVASVSFLNKGTVNLNNAATIQNSATLYNTGNLNLNSTNNFTVNDAKITNYGIINTKGAITLNTNATLANYCTIICGKDFKNNGAVTNMGKLLLTTTTPGYLFLNQGAFVNGPDGFVQGYDFQSTGGSITGGGNFYFASTTKNQAAFNGSAASNINFYDATPCSLGNGCSVNDIFDSQNSNPLYTTKNKISPITNFNFTACGEPAPPTITTQPQTVSLCSSSNMSATFNVAATSTYSNMTYQWRKNGVDIPGATAGSYTATNVSLADTTNKYSVAITNGTGTTISNSVSVHYIIIAQPSPDSEYLATGNNITFTIQTSGATSLQWQKNNIAIANAISNAFSIPVVNLTDAGYYSALVTFSGGTCTSSAAILKTSIILYSKASGNLRNAANWGVNPDGSGSTPVNFTRDEHTYIVSNRSRATTGGPLTIAGTLDVAEANVVLTPGSTLTAGRVIRTISAGAFSGSATSSLKITGISNTKYAGASDIYFKTGADTLQNLTIAGHTVTLRTTLNLTAGNNPGILQVTSGSFNTSDLLTLKSDASGTAIVATSLGTINGKVTVERYIPARRAWRLMCPPVKATDAPTINAAWQEGATSSTDDPHPGFGTHITYGSTADGFDQNPQKTFSMYYWNSTKWTGVPATNKTPVTNFTGYLFFIRGDRSYDIANTTNTVAARSTVLRTTGYLNQGRQADISANSTGFTLVANPYASPVDFEQVYNSSSNIKHTVRVWDPSLAGVKGVGAYVTLDWTGSGYKATPPSAMTNVIQPYQAFFVQSTTAAGSVSLTEGSKNITTVTNPFGRSMTAREMKDAMLEVNLRVFNEDSTTGIADGILYRFNDTYDNAVDGDDVNKFSNLYENLSILSNNSLLTIERRQMPVANDTLHLYLTGAKTTNYQLEIVPQDLGKAMFLYDNYLKTLSPISLSDTNHFTISINTADAFSKAANRFSIVMQNNIVLPVNFSSAKAYAKGRTVQVEWKVANEAEVQYYEIEKSANGSTFSKAGAVKATGATSYSFNDAAPFDGDSYYRVKSIDKSGKPNYTSILPVTFNNSDKTGNFSIYPNPLKGKSFQVKFSNKTAGTYTLTLAGSNGQLLYIQTISYKGGTAVFNVQLKSNLALGLYFIKATAADGTTDVIKAVVQ